jgi:ubiquinone/menaquinone biosynthesis C-methylase UbiE
VNKRKEKQKPVPKAMFKMMAFTAMAFYRFMNLINQVKRSGVREGQTVLDFGCGSGHFTVAAAQIVGEGGRVYALDIHPLAIKAVERKVTKSNLSNVTTILSDRETGLPEDSIDVVLLYRTFYLVRDKKGLLDELYRVMRPSGILSVLGGGIAACLKTIERDGRFSISEHSRRLLNLIKK